VDDDEGVQVLRASASKVPWTGFAVNGFRLRRAIEFLHRRSPIQVIDGAESAFALLSKRMPVAKVIRMHGGHHFFATTLGLRPSLWRGWLERRSFASADHFCAVSRFVADETRRLLQLGRAAIEILPNPVDTGRFQPMPDVPVVPGRIAFVGTLCEKKGIRQLAQAMPRIAAAVPEARLVAFGRDSIDRTTGRSYRAGLLAALPSEARSLIDFPDHLDNRELPFALASAQALVFPSLMEAQGIVIIEGMAMGKPVVSSKTGPGPEVIEDGKSGLLCDPHDPFSIAQSVIRVLKDQDLSSRLGAAARNRALDEFSADSLVVRNEGFYDRCLSGIPHG
jgi:glycosyltransferase involved in cell wall biosynthesis